MSVSGSKFNAFGSNNCEVQFTSIRAIELRESERYVERAVKKDGGHLNLTQMQNDDMLFANFNEVTQRPKQNARTEPIL